MPKYTESEIAQIIKENQRLSRENQDLKKLTSSKRFHFAESIATKFNLLLPKDTKRRRYAEKTYSAIRKPLAKISQNRFNKTSQNLNTLVRPYSKIIVINSIFWNIKLQQRPHHFAREFRKLGFFVIYLERENTSRRLSVIEDGLVVISDFNLILKLPPIAKTYFLTPNNLPTSLAELKQLKKQGIKIIYDYLDEFNEEIAGNLSTQLEVWDGLTELKPHLCLATANKLYQDLKDIFDGDERHLLLCKNAVNTEHFDFTQNTAHTPNELKDIVSANRQIIGFYGALAPWIDFNLLNQIAINHPEWYFVYIGSDYGNAARQLQSLPNVLNLGVKDYADLPKYTKFFNCAIIPFKKGDIAKATSPVKLFEYMAAGLPVVCTRDLAECSGYKYVYMSKSDVDFEKNLTIALKTYQDSNARLELLAQAKDNTWSARATAIAKSLK